MEHYYRCDECGKKSPSFDNEQNLEKYSYNWNIIGELVSCDECKNKKEDNFFKHGIRNTILMIIAIVSMIICWLIFT